MDEAYVEYVDPEVRLDRVRDVEAGLPVVVMRTFSKIFGLAGLRLGYAIVDEPLAAMIDVVLEPFNVNRAALAAGRASLERTALIDDRRLANEAGRGAARGAPPRGRRDAVSVAGELPPRRRRRGRRRPDRGLARRGFLVRAGSEFGLAGFVRITTGPIPLMERVAAELAGTLSQLLLRDSTQPCPDTSATACGSTGSASPPFGAASTRSASTGRYTCTGVPCS